MAFEYTQELVNDYEKLLEIDEGCDVIIYAGEDDNAKEIHAHSLILCIRSQYFRAAFSNEWANKKDGKFILNKPNISSQVFKIILRYIYCGKIDLTKLQGPETLDVLMAVDELSIQTLIPCIQEHLINYQHEFLQQNPIEILETIYQVCQHDTFKDLWDFFLETICEKPEILFNSDKLIRLNASLLELIIKRNDLLLDEIDVWENLINWSFAQHPFIQQDVKKWNEEEITIMKSTSHRFIPLIRFYHISSEDFRLKVCPFEVLLPKDLINNILTFHMSPNKKLDNSIQPPRNPKYDTDLIKPRYFAIFSSWIEKKGYSYYNHYNLNQIPYHFNLIYRASRDGNTAEEFHKECDNKGATIVIIKIKGSEQIVGGYNPFDWESSDSHKTTTDSFVFSFTDRKNIKTANVVGYGNNTLNIGCFSSRGPIFCGCLYKNGDTTTTWNIHDNSCYYSISYSSIGIQTGSSVNVDDYEVFQVIKKN